MISALSGTKQNLIEESADLVYHLLVLWADAEIEPEIIWDELLQKEWPVGYGGKITT